MFFMVIPCKSLCAKQMISFLHSAVQAEMAAGRNLVPVLR